MFVDQIHGAGKHVRGVSTKLPEQRCKGELPLWESRKVHVISQSRTPFFYMYGVPALLSLNAWQRRLCAFCLRLQRSPWAAHRNSSEYVCK